MGSDTRLGYGKGRDGYTDLTLAPITAQVASEGPGFVVAGSGRSGSTYISHVLQKVGIRCGHEEWFTPFIHRRVVGIHGDSSWMCVPVLDHYHGKIFVQARHPFRVVGSLASYDHGGFMRGDLEDSVFWRLKCDALPILKLRKDAVYNSVLWYLAVYERALRFADMWWRVEDLTPELLQSVTESIGRPASLEDCQLAIKGTGKRVHAHHQGTRDISWADIPEPLHDRLGALMEQLGY